MGDRIEQTFFFYSNKNWKLKAFLLNATDLGCLGVSIFRGEMTLESYKKCSTLTTPSLSHPFFLAALDIISLCSQNEKIAHGNWFFCCTQVIKLQKQMNTTQQVEIEQLTFSVSLCFIVTTNPCLITCYFQSSGGERALPVQAFWYTQGLELVHRRNWYSDFLLLYKLP